MIRPVLVDGRNLYEPRSPRLGFLYFAIGRGTPEAVK